jgi:hypothetical protein
MGGGRFIGGVSNNKSPITTALIRHEDILNGSSITIRTGDRPDSEWNRTATIAALPSLNPPLTTAPFFVSQGRSFTDSMTVEIRNTAPGATIFYRFAADTTFIRYEQPIILKGGAVIHSYAEQSGHLRGKTIKAEFVRTSFVGTIRLQTQYSHQYTGGSDQALVDGVRGGPDFRLGAWQGYEGTDAAVVLDLGKIRTIDSVRLGCLQDENSWIFFPEHVEFSFSSDGTAFSRKIVVRNDIPLRAPGALLKEFAVKGEPARFVKVRAKNIGLCPPWHKGSGGKAWVFVDELIVDVKE